MKHNLSRQEMRQLNMELENMKEENRENTHITVEKYNQSNNFNIHKVDIVLNLLDERAATEETFSTNLLKSILMANTEPGKFFFFSGNMIQSYLVIQVIMDFCLDWFIHEYLIVKETRDIIHSKQNNNNMPINKYIPILMAYTGGSKLNYQLTDFHTSERLDFKHGEDIIRNILGMSAKQGDTILDLSPSPYYPTIEVAESLHCDTISIISNNKQKDWHRKQLTSIKLR